MQKKKNLYRAAIYLRLSRDDAEKGESNSIQNQRIMLKAFIENDPQLELKREFVDDGFTGTSYERPGFQKMMQQVKNGLIDCIVVKDLSRLGRNYIETGRYLEQVFPSLGVRFIAVNDHYDNFGDADDSNDILIPFKNLINDAYCRDISTKIRSQLEVQRRNGNFIGSFPAYGYVKDPKDKHHLIIDEKSAEIVRTIFDMKLDGYSPTKIADKLNEMGVLPPLQYKRSIGMNCNCGYWKGEESKWYPAKVQSILTNEVYLGTISQGKNRKISYKIKKSIPVDRENWICVEERHEPIISKAVFERVQEMLSRDTRTSPDKDTVEILSGYVKCGGCGQNMIRRSVKRSDRIYTYFTCSTHKNGQGCSSHLINAEKLETIVLHALQRQVLLLLRAAKLIEETEKIPMESHRVRVLDLQLDQLQQEKEKYEQMNRRLYIDYTERFIGREEYDEMRKAFDQKILNIAKTRVNIEQEREKALAEPFIQPAWLEEIKSYGTVKSLNRRMVVMMVDRIIVHSKSEVEVRFLWEDEIKELCQQMKEGSE